MDNNNPYADLEQKYANNINQQNEWLNESEKIQNEQIDANTKQTLNEIEQQRKYTQQDFNKEARGAYQDYKNLVNPYGVQAENIYSNGLGNSGYSETSKLNAYNTYQNRYATARESTDRLMEDFNNQMTQAQLEGNRELAQVALNKLQTQMDNLWNQLNFDSSLTQNKANYNQWLEQFEHQKQQDAISNSSSSGSSSYSNYSNPYALTDTYLIDSANENNGNVDNNLTSSNKSNSKTSRSSVIPIGLRVSDWANYLYANR